MLPYLTALFVLFWRLNGVGGLWFEGDNWKKVVNFLRQKVHAGDLAGGFSDLELTWLLYWAGAATALPPDLLNFAATLYNSVASKATVMTVFMEQGRTVRGDFASSPWSLQMANHSAAAAAAG